MRVVFFGSPDFAVPSLDAVVGAGHEVTLVVSQPAKPAGRKGELREPAVAERAGTRGIPRFQPPTLKPDDAVARLAAENADVFVVVAYGKILAQRVLDLPRVSCVNVHGSILPRWRGASPIQASLLAGDDETGVSIMKMEAGMDTGPVYAALRTPIGERETAGELTDRLAALGAGLLVETLPKIASGDVAPVPQDVRRATTCPKIRREDGRVDWTRPAIEIVRRARAFSPWPGLFTFRGGDRIKLAGVVESPGGEGAPGTVLSVDERVVVSCGAGAVAIETLQSEGRRALTAPEFARGERLRVGETFA